MPYPSIPAAIYAALGCTEIDRRSPNKLWEASEQIANFVVNSEPYLRLLKYAEREQSE